MSLSETFLFLHIAAAGIWLGANIVQIAVPSLSRSESTSFSAGWLRIGAKLGRVLYMPVGVLLLASGVGLVLTSEGAYEFSDLFVSIGFAVIVIGAVLGAAVFAPGGFKAAEAFERGDETTGRATTRRLAGFGVIDTLLLLFAIVVMILRLGS